MCTDLKRIDVRFPCGLQAAAEAERAALERAALAQRSSFDSSRAALEEQLQQLSASISAQQQQLEAAQEAERAAKELAAKWQVRTNPKNFISSGLLPVQPFLACHPGTPSTPRAPRSHNGALFSTSR